MDKGESGNEKKGRGPRIHMETTDKCIEGRDKRYLKHWRSLFKKDVTEQKIKQ